jgi:hypothetical protein
VYIKRLARLSFKLNLLEIPESSIIPIKNSEPMTNLARNGAVKSLAIPERRMSFSRYSAGTSLTAPEKIKARPIKIRISTFSIVCKKLIQNPHPFQNRPYLNLKMLRLKHRF